VPGYTYPSSDTVKNKLGARTLEELERLEGPLVGFRRAEVDAGRGPVGEFDAAHLKALHAFLFQDVFEWAGTRAMSACVSRMARLPLSR
jgi:cell filamentation protein